MQNSLGTISNDYLTLMQSYLIGSIFRDPAAERLRPGAFKKPFEQRYFDTYLRENGADVPKNAFTMIGAKRMANIRTLAETLIRDQIEGDFIETGVWRGGASIFMRAILLAYGIKDRRVWLADSFEGLPKADAEKYPADNFVDFSSIDLLKVSLEVVQENFSQLDLLDDQVKFLKGWFKDTLPNAPIKQLALLRLDGDMYESTMDALNALYPKLSPGGYVIVDDYVLPCCKLAIHDFFKSQGIDPELVTIDEYSVYWRKSAPDKITSLEKASVTPTLAPASTELIRPILKLNQVVITKLTEALNESDGKFNRLNKKINSLTNQGEPK